MRLLLAGEAAAAVAVPGAPAGRVVAVFRRAVYLSYPSGIVALVPADVEPGPLHAQVTALPSVAVGEEVRLPPCGEVWRPPPVPALDGVPAVLSGLLDHVPDLTLGAGPGPAGERVLRATLRRDGLEAAVTALAGRGSGLTPAGDDVVAGLLFVARAAGGCEADLVALARRAPTHDISRAFLAWAARGQSLAALHDLVGSCAEGDVPSARRARARLARAGHTSGLDLAYGVLTGCTHLREGGP